MKRDFLKIASKKFNSRLIVGTGKYKNFLECSKAIKAAGAEIVTVAVRRVNITDKSKPLLMDYIDPKKNYLFNKYSRMIYFQWCFKNIKTCERDWRMETG